LIGGTGVEVANGFAVGRGVLGVPVPLELEVGVADIDGFGVAVGAGVLVGTAVC